ncbi:MAG: DUF2971 domain-containing protein [Kiritimatiellaceae bacterium]|nr:DUF2971 domain-containing protein [Kiritimatiellaceae bacterium]
MNSDILYHYCSNEAFHSIVSNHSIRLSSLLLSNDSMEGRLVSGLITELAKENGLDQAKAQRLQENIIQFESMFDGLGFCFSEKGDLLSQWRGYADDASGVSIGFSKKYLTRLPAAYKDKRKDGFFLDQVTYDRETQKKLITPIFKEMIERINRGAFNIPNHGTIIFPRSAEDIAQEEGQIALALADLHLKSLDLFGVIFSFKTSAFSEESEWRLLSHLFHIGKIDTECEFRVVRKKIVPYREFPLQKLELNAIHDVFLGPKNTTPENVVRGLLESNGFSDVTVKRSSASYK